MIYVMYAISIATNIFLCFLCYKLYRVLEVDEAILTAVLRVLDKDKEEDNEVEYPQEDDV